MGAIETRVFKNGNSAAVRLPVALGIAPGTLVTVEGTKDGLTIKPVKDPDQDRRALAQMLSDIQAIWAAAGGPPPPQVREPIEFPDRPGLYD